MGKQYDAVRTIGIAPWGNTLNISNKGKEATVIARIQGIATRAKYVSEEVTRWRNGQPMAKSLSKDTAAKVYMDAIADRKSKNQISALVLIVISTAFSMTHIYIGIDIEPTMMSAQANEMSR